LTVALEVVYSGAKESGCEGKWCEVLYVWKEKDVRKGCEEDIYKASITNNNC
jgi:hypothetical protein